MTAVGPFEPTPAVMVAVSGGGDSIALLHLADHWVRARGGSLVVGHVDHRLRPDSGADASFVRTRAAALGWPVVVEEWRHDAVHSGIQSRARDARYGLLQEACHRLGVLHLLTAHTADDQAETVAMRRARHGEGRGLAGMAPIRELEQVRVVRPLLTIAGATLRAWLTGQRLTWRQDPSNQNSRFERVRIRQSGPVPDMAWSLLGRERADLERSAVLLAGETMAIQPDGTVALSLPGLLTAPVSVVVEMLAHCLAWVAQSPYRLSAAQAQALWHRGRGLAPGAAVTGGWCVIRRRRAALIVHRDPRNRPNLSPAVRIAAFRTLFAVARWPDVPMLFYNGGAVPLP